MTPDNVFNKKPKSALVYLKFYIILTCVNVSHVL